MKTPRRTDPGTTSERPETDAVTRSMQPLSLTPGPVRILAGPADSA